MNSGTMVLDRDIYCDSCPFIVAPVILLTPLFNDMGDARLVSWKIRDRGWLV